MLCEQRKKNYSIWSCRPPSQFTGPLLDLITDIIFLIFCSAYAVPFVYVIKGIWSWVRMDSNCGKHVFFSSWSSLYMYYIFNEMFHHRRTWIFINILEVNSYLVLSISLIYVLFYHSTLPKNVLDY